MISGSRRLYTWLDVEELLIDMQTEGQWPDWLVSAEAYWDGMTLSIRPGTRMQALSWLDGLYSPRFDRAEEAIVLESLSGSKRLFKVSLWETDEEPHRPRFMPLFSRPSVFWPPAPNPVTPESLAPELPPIVAVHSFKGGVGRTLHAVALAKAIVQSAHAQDRVLLVDGDLEAPGISWLIRSRVPEPPVSFADFLALAHGDPDPTRKDSIAIVADRLRDVLVGGIHILPAFRSDKHSYSLEIRPEHLIRGSEDPYCLTSLLAKLGEALGVRGIVVDLRAGLSELAAGLLLDPRVHRVLVTTPSSQSVRGTCLLLELLSRLAPSTREEHPLPALVITQVSHEHWASGLVSQVEQQLLEAARSFLSDDRDPPRVVTRFESGLLALPPDWEDVMDRIEKAGLVEAVYPLLHWLPGGKAARPDVAVAADLSGQRRCLAEFAEKLVYAEQGEGEDFLAIEALRRLASDHKHRVPIAVVVGAKGAGKTYTFLQIVRRKVWGEFVKAAGLDDVHSGALICPLLWSTNLGDKATDVVRRARLSVISELGLSTDDALDNMGVRDGIRDSVRESLHEGQWRERWVDMMAWAVGCRNRESGAGRCLIEHLRVTGRQMVVVVDGLEDIFQNLATSESEQRSLRALLQDVPEWLRQQPDPFLGLLVFVRRDMVLAAVRQNAAQLMARYEPYALRWSSEEALRLVAWIARKVGILPDVGGDRLREADRHELEERLVPLWGRKLGQDRSREARSAEWVIAALSDLRGQIQARDLVRLLAVAAKGSRDDRYWTDRILSPQSLRGALPECSQHKIAETTMENPVLGEVLDHLNRLSGDVKQIPFTADQVKLDRNQIRMLEDSGVILREGDEYYMPEIFRLGLGFQLKMGARPRVLSLARRARMSL